MDLVSDSEWLYRQDLTKIHHGQLPFLGSLGTTAVLRMMGSQFHLFGVELA